MSVILDALHKARSDKRNPQPETQPNSVARVLDAGAASEAMLDAHDGGAAGRGRGGRSGRGGWVVVLSVFFGLACLSALVGGAFFLLYYQGKRLEESRIVGTKTSEAGGSIAPVNTGIPVINGTDALASSEAAQILETGLALPTVPSLPTPLPLSDLPVQPPARAAAAAVTVEVAPQQPAAAIVAPAVAGTASAPVVAAAPSFKLGSIVCDNNDCLASLNGRTIRVGDEIRQYRVLRITSKEVTLKSITGNDVVTLSLYD